MTLKQKKYAAFISGGKDGYLAMLKVLNAGNKVTCLMNIDGGLKHKQIFHDTNKSKFIKLQAQRLNIPLMIVKAPENMRGGINNLEETLAYMAEIAAKKYDFNAICCGSTDEDEAGNAKEFEIAGKNAGIQLEAPLKGLKLREIMELKEKTGTKAIIIATEKERIPESFLGQQADINICDFIDKSKANGIFCDGNDFQTLVTNCQLFSKPIEILKTEKSSDIERNYLEIIDFC